MSVLFNQMGTTLKDATLRKTKNKSSAEKLRISLFAAAVLWSSASARPHNPEQQGAIDAFARWAIAEMEQVPEPHKTKLTNILQEAQQQHWDNLTECVSDVRSMLLRHLQESGVEFSRRKRDIDSDEDVDGDELRMRFLYGAYARFLVLMAPPAHQEALEEKYAGALEKDYENEDDFAIEAVKIFEEQTGLDYKKAEAELDADEEKAARLEKKVTEEFVNAITSDFAGHADSSEEE